MARRGDLFLNDFPITNIYPKNTFVSREFFYFQILEGGRLAIWNRSGRDYRFVAQKGLIIVFQ